MTDYKRKTKYYKSKSIWALYKGEELIGIGTIEELAELTNVKKESIMFYYSPSYKKRKKNSINRKTLVLVEKRN
ncbi:MAG: hypothetical protein J6T10_28230 [Methanobrevibacter sp.]|nr:hypothetical protein [Methanobrevibacter sp.]